MTVTYKSFEAGILDWMQAELVQNMHGVQRFAMTAMMVAYVPVASKMYNNNIKLLKDMEVVTEEGMIDLTKLDSILKKSFSMNGDRLTMHIPAVGGDVTVRPTDVDKLMEHIARHSSGS